MPAVQERFLKCTVKDGMFSDEVVVSVTRTDGETESFFVPAGAVDRRKGRMRVWVREVKPGRTLIASIPTCEPSTAVAVRPEDLD